MCVCRFVPKSWEAFTTAPELAVTASGSGLKACTKHEQLLWPLICVVAVVALMGLTNLFWCYNTYYGD